LTFLYVTDIISLNVNYKGVIIMKEKRSSFTGKLGFVLAAAGSAVGLGNIWRFPYLAAQHGGGIFLLTYLILAVTFGFALLCTEIAIGRKTGKSAIDAFKSLDKRFSFIGWIAAIIPVLILPYYSVIGGWVIKYFAVYLTGNGLDAAKGDFFGSFISHSFEPLIWFFVFIAITALVVLLGVEKGIEKVSKIMMPILVILIIFISIYVLFMPGAIKGVLYYITPDFSKFSFTTVLAALGQLFYSMSIAMGIMITYGSYMKKDINLESAVSHIEIFDTGIAFLAGLMIIPAVFAGPGEEKLTMGAGLMFQILPTVFADMKGGQIIGALFFLLVFFAAVTSSISLMETIVSIISDKLGWGRKKSCLAVFLISLFLGALSSLGYGPLSGISITTAAKTLQILDVFDFITNSVLMPIVAFLTCIFVAYILKPKTVIEEIKLSGSFKREKMYVLMVKYIAPLCIIAILIFSVLEALGIISL